MNMIVDTIEVDVNYLINWLASNALYFTSNKSNLLLYDIRNIN